MLKQGEICQGYFYVEKGLLRMYSIDDFDKEHILQFASEQWFISDRTSLYFGVPSQFYIQAIEDTVVMQFNDQIHCMIAEQNPSYQKYNEQITQSHIRYLQNKIHLLISASAKDRIFRLYESVFQSYTADTSMDDCFLSWNHSRKSKPCA